MVHLFVDTNIFLRFYNFDSESLDRLRRLVDRIKENKLALYLPDQVEIEFFVNREAFLLNIISKLDSAKDKIENIKIDFPKSDWTSDFNNALSDIESEIEKLRKEFSAKIGKITKELKSKIKDEMLAADQIIKEFFSLAKKLESSEAIISKAEKRMLRNVPPATGKSISDALIWELLLTYVPNEEDLHFVSDDNHFSSKIDETDLSPFLKKEWKELKKSKILFYRNLFDFIKKELPQLYSESTKKAEISSAEMLFRFDESLMRNYQEMLESLSELQKQYSEQSKKIADSLRVEPDFLRQIIESALKYITAKKA
jgi:predicted nucleic acid-binding protein